VITARDSKVVACMVSCRQLMRARQLSTRPHSLGAHAARAVPRRV